MADPISENETDDGSAEEPICRICNCEATEEEPLFYPCKCSGSMKYIHQDCLVAWLAHSKKQQCEFCGTPFRFSKQYSELSELPARVLFRRLAAYGLNCTVTLFRFCLVVMVWLVWVPHLTTTIWNMLLWCGNGEWSSLQLGPRYVSPPLSPDLGIFVPTIAAKISVIKHRLTIAKYAASFRDARIGKPFLFLGKVGFLKSLTPVSVINDFLVYTLDGQVLTLVSLLCFNLYLQLLGEWLEHQQTGTAAETDDLREPNVIRASITALKARLGLDGADDGANFHRKMELIGMRGPLFKFLMKAQTCGGMAFVALTPVVWFPYHIGRLGLILVANPLATLTFPIKMISSSLGLLVDVVLMIYEYATLAVYILMGFLNASRFSTFMAEDQTWDTQDVSLAAEERIISRCVNWIEQFVQFSSISHQALQQIKGWLLITSQLVSKNAQALLTGDSWKAVSQHRAWVGMAAAARKLCNRAIDILIAQIWPSTAKSDQEHANKRPPPVYWEVIDRLWAILMGYIVLTILGALLLRYRESASRRAGQNSQVRSASSIRRLGASMKVILFICIQKLMMPLYCGILIIHLFPGFGDMAFTLRSPSQLDSYLSVFVQWLAGKYFMSRLSLFISFCGDSVCRDVVHKIRSLYSLSLHPARDILERSIINLLLRTALSTLAYGVLIFFCSSTVRRLSLFLDSILHIHWSINDSSLELLLNSVLCSSVIPLSVNFFSAHGGLHVAYKWWNNKCVQILRLTQMMDPENLSESRATETTTEEKSDSKATLDRGSSQVIKNLKTSLQVLGYILSVFLFTVAIALYVIVLPLFTGRTILTQTVSRDIPINDTCALVLGLYILGIVMHVTLHYQYIVTCIKELVSRSNTPVQFFRLATGIISYTARALYIYASTFIYLPTLLAVITNIYLILPLRGFSHLNEPNSSFMLQSGMIELLYIDFATTIILRSNSDLLKLIRSLILDNSLPYAWAFTRAIVIPGTLSYIVFLSPFSGAYIVPALQGTLDKASIQVMYQTSFLEIAYSILITTGTWIIFKLLSGCIRELRDEVFLKGERLHNFE